MRPDARRCLLLTLVLMACNSPFARRAMPERVSRFDGNSAAASQSAPKAEPRDAISGQPASVAAEAKDGSELPNASTDPTAIPSMIIRNGQASVEVDSLELAVARVRDLAGRLGGYIANSQMQAGRNQLRLATLEIKVPAGRFEEVANGLTPIGRVESVNITAEDVGEEFTDITARVANAHRLEQRLIDLLATRTGKLSDVLEIERELARVREEIERMEGRLRFLKTRVATSTLSVTVHERAPLVGQVGSGSVIAEALRQAWRNFVNFIAELIASLGVLLPLGALVITGALGARRLWQAHRRSAS